MKLLLILPLLALVLVAAGPAPTTQPESQPTSQPSTQPALTIAEIFKDFPSDSVVKPGNDGQFQLILWHIFKGRSLSLSGKVQSCNSPQLRPTTTVNGVQYKTTTQADYTVAMLAIIPNPGVFPKEMKRCYLRVFAYSPKSLVKQEQATVEGTVARIEARYQNDIERGQTVPVLEITLSPKEDKPLVADPK